MAVTQRNLLAAVMLVWGCADARAPIVEPPPPRTGAIGISVSPPAATVRISDTLTFRVTASNVDHLVVWSSSRPEVARVDEVTGLVTAIAAGSAFVVATTRANSNFRAGAQLTVIP